MIIVALVMLIFPIFNDAFIKKSSDDLAKIVTTELTAKDLKTNQNSQANFDFSSVRNIDATSTWGKINQYNRKNIIGQIVIPSIKLNLTLFKGLDEANLIAGVGTMKPDQVMGKGNYTIAGHRAIKSETLFNKLMDVKEGDIVRITDKEKIYRYVVKKTVKTANDALEMIEDDQMKNYDNKPIISLMTCYYGSSDARWFVVGVLEDVVDYTPEAMIKNIE